jgi:hypothetical protein
MTLLSQSGENLLGVAAATKGDIHINAVGLDVQSVDALFQEDRYVICIHCGYHQLSILD